MRKIYLRTWYFIYLARKYNWSKYLKQLSSELFLNKCPITLTHFATKNTLGSAAFPQKEKNVSSQKRRPSCFFFCCLQQLLWCLCKQAPFPEAIPALEIWAQQLPAGRDMGPEARQDGDDGRGQPGWGAPPEGNAHLGFHASVSGPPCGAGKKHRLLNVSANKAWAFSKDGNLEFPVSWTLRCF